jgi:hypothetical protein
MTTAPKETTTGAWICDDAFLAAAEDDLRRFVLDVETDRDFDVEVLVDPYVDAPHDGAARLAELRARGCSSQ